MITLSLSRRVIISLSNNPNSNLRTILTLQRQEDMMVVVWYGTTTHVPPYVPKEIVMVGMVYHFEELWDGMLRKCAMKNRL